MLFIKMKEWNMNNRPVLDVETILQEVNVKNVKILKDVHNVKI